LRLGDLPRFVFCYDCLIRGADFVSEGESEIVAKVGIETGEELVKAGDCFGVHLVWLVSLAFVAQLGRPYFTA